MDKYITAGKCDEQDFLFKSAKGENQAIQINHVNKLMKKWTQAINLKQGNYGALTLRKTWGYQ